MKRSDTNLTERLRLIGRANEDQYFHRLDQELIEKLRATAAAQTETTAQPAGRPEHAFSRLLVPVDFSEHSQLALDYAADIAARYGSTVVVLHVIAEDALETRLTERHPGRPLMLRTGDLEDGGLDPGPVVRELREKAYDALREFLPLRLLRTADGQRIELRALIGRPAERIIEAAGDERADLIVLGSHGRTGVSRMLAGSIAERVVRLAPCPVLTVKAGE